MIINNNLQGIASVYANHRSTNKVAHTEREEVRSDEIHISTKAQNASEMLKKLNAMDNVRSDRVAELENMIGIKHVELSFLIERLCQRGGMHRNVAEFSTDYSHTDN